MRFICIYLHIYHYILILLFHVLYIQPDVCVCVWSPPEHFPGVKYTRTTRTSHSSSLRFPQFPSKIAWH